MKWVVTVLLPAVVVPLLLNVFTDWSPRLAQWIVDRASRRMPKRYRDRCADEWRAYLADIPGGLSKLAVALGYWVRIPLLRRAVGAPAFRFRLIRAIGKTPHSLRGTESLIDIGRGAVGGAVGSAIGGSIGGAVGSGIPGGLAIGLIGAVGGAAIGIPVGLAAGEAVSRKRARRSTSPNRSRPRAGS